MRMLPLVSVVALATAALAPPAASQEHRGKLDQQTRQEIRKIVREEIRAALRDFRQTDKAPAKVAKQGKGKDTIVSVGKGDWTVAAPKAVRVNRAVKVNRAVNVKKPAIATETHFGHVNDEGEVVIVRPDAKAGNVRVRVHKSDDKQPKKLRWTTVDTGKGELEEIEEIEAELGELESVIAELEVQLEATDDLAETLKGLKGKVIAVPEIGVDQITMLGGDFTVLGKDVEKKVLQELHNKLKGDLGSFTFEVQGHGQDQDKAKDCCKSGKCCDCCKSCSKHSHEGHEGHGKHEGKAGAHRVMIHSGDDPHVMFFGKDGGHEVIKSGVGHIIIQKDGEKILQKTFDLNDVHKDALLKSMDLEKLHKAHGIELDVDVHKLHKAHGVELEEAEAQILKLRDASGEPKVIRFNTKSPHGIDANAFVEVKAGSGCCQEGEAKAEKAEGCTGSCGEGEAKAIEVHVEHAHGKEHKHEVEKAEGGCGGGCGEAEAKAIEVHVEVEHAHGNEHGHKSEKTEERKVIRRRIN